MRSVMEKLDKWTGKFELVFEHIAGAGCFLLMICVVIEVVSRYVLQTVLITGLYNITESWVFPLLIFFALAGGYRVGLWPKLEIIIGSMRPSNARIVNLITLGIELVLYLIAAYFTMAYAYEMTLERRQMQAGSLTYPLYPILLTVPFAFFMLSLEVFLKLWKEGKQKK